METTQNDTQQLKIDEISSLSATTECIKKEDNHNGYELSLDTVMNSKDKRNSNPTLSSANSLNEQQHHHKRSTSANSEILFSHHYQSTPDLTLKNQPPFSPTNSNNSPFSLKKRWFQLPRMNLKRQQSTPPLKRSGYGGMKPGTVEPPDPPPQLLYNLDWSTKPIDTCQTVVTGSISTPASPIISYSDVESSGGCRRRSSIATTVVTNHDMLPAPVSVEKQQHHQKSSSLSSTSTIVEDEELSEEAFQMFIKNEKNLNGSCLLRRRLSCPNDEKLDLFFSPTFESAVTTIKKKSKKKFIKSPISPSKSSPLPSTMAASVDGSADKMATHSNQNNNVLFFDIYIPHTKKLVMSFKQIKPRTVKLRRRTHHKFETRAILEWQYQLIKSLNQNYFKQQERPTDHLPIEKRTRYSQTRKFILREFYTTEINFWNQLNYSKVMFCDPLKLALERNSTLVKASDLDWFANLDDLMSFSSTLIHRFKNSNQNEEKGESGSTLVSDQLDDINNKMEALNTGCSPLLDDVHIGQILHDMAEFMIIFLRCALDYKSNKKLLNQSKHNKGYALYREKLALRKETRQFTLDDYLIIPIQRVTRYSLLLTDLEKHTETMHPDYENIRIVNYIIQSLASAMNYAQK
ncbi:MAG: Dbl homology domain-containing protein [Benjaminiella poitrasii]|nr:MAG: Dbl homology domain-containing protein [Benjaminiella poitrasii]